MLPSRRSGLPRRAFCHKRETCSYGMQCSSTAVPRLLVRGRRARAWRSTTSVASALVIAPKELHGKHRRSTSPRTWERRVGEESSANREMAGARVYARR